MKFYYYVCPRCKRSSREMMPYNTFIVLTNDQKQEYRDLAPIAHELLECPCGKIMAWFEMEEVESGVEF